MIKVSVNIEEEFSAELSLLFRLHQD